MGVKKKDGAAFDSYQENVLSMISDMFPETELTATSGHRTPLEQLHTIGAYAHGFAYPEFDPQDVDGTVRVEYEGHELTVKKWWRTWGECLHRGIIINPPVAAVVPFDYLHDGRNKKGETIQASNHTIPLDADPSKQPCPIDFSHFIDSKPDIERVHQCMLQAQASGVPIKSIVVEHGNGCVHLNLVAKKEK